MRRIAVLCSVAALAAATLVVTMRGPSPAGAAPFTLTKAAEWLTPPFSPYHQKATGEVFSSAAVADISGDGQPDVVAGYPDGKVHAWTTTNGALFRTFDTGPGAVQASPTLVDLTGDGVRDVLAANTAGDIAAWRADGVQIFRKHDVCKPDPLSACGFFATPTTGDIDRDGQLEIVATSWDQHLYVWNLDGSLVPGFPRLLQDTIWSSPSVADIDGDGWPEIVVGGDCEGVQGQRCHPQRGGYVWAIRHDGTDQPGWPVFTPGQVVWSSPAITDLDGDGLLDVIVGTGNQMEGDGYRVYAFDRAGRNLPGWPAGIFGRPTASPAVGDIDADGSPDVVILGDDGRLYAYGRTGQLLRGWPQCVANARAHGCPLPLHASPTIADAFGDGRQRVVIGGEQWVRVFNGDGTLAAETGTVSGTVPITAAITVANVKGEAWLVANTSRVVGGTTPAVGSIWAWRTGSPHGRSAWPTFKQNPGRTGFVADVLPSDPVLRLSGPDRIATSVAIAGSSHPGARSAPGVVLARSDDFADALAGTPLAAELGGPLLLTPPRRSGGSPLDPQTELELRHVTSTGGRVAILGGSAALDPAIDGYLEALGYDVDRYAGADRFATAAAVAGAVAAPDFALVATGRNFADALPGGAAAAANGGVVLLSDGPNRTGATDDWLAEHPDVRTYCLGGPACAAYGGEVAEGDELVGPDRYATSVEVARAFFDDPSVVGIASGLSFPDGLAGGAHVARAGGPLLLTDPAGLPGSSVVAYLRDNAAAIGRSFVYGGEVAVSSRAALGAGRATA